VLRYAHEHGCLIDFDECCFVAEYGRHAIVVEVMEYLLAAQLAA